MFEEAIIKKIDSLERSVIYSTDVSADVSIVIVSWNVADLLEGCVKSLLANSPDLSLQIIVVDNASTDHTRQILRDKFPWVQVIANEENKGFARANNQALSRVTSQFVLILNPDTVLRAEALKKMTDFLKDHPEVGIVGPRLCYPDGKTQETSARLLPTLTSTLVCNTLQLTKLPLIGRFLKKRYFSAYNYDASQEVEAISGAAMLVRHKVIEAIRGFGESFIHAGEDLDFCFRARKTGWKIYYLCDAVVVHYTGQSSRQVPVRTSVNTLLSVQQYFNRCFGLGHGLLYRLTIQAIQVPIIVVHGCCKFLLRLEPSCELKRRWEIAKAIWLWRELK